MKKSVKSNINLIITNIFQISLILYLLLLLIETYISGFTTNLFDLQWFLVIIGISGLLLLIINQNQKNNQKSSIAWWEYLFIFFISIFSGILVFIAIKDIRWVAYIISICCTLLVLIISFSILNNTDTIAKEIEKVPNHKIETNQKYFILKTENQNMPIFCMTIKSQMILKLKALLQQKNLTKMK